MNRVLAFVLAGGSGERLWPLSHADQPKQLIPFVGGSSLLEQTIARIEHAEITRRDDVWVVTSERYAAAVSSAVGGRVGRVVAEPEARNTGPAVLYTCLLAARDGLDGVVVVVPADHFIPSEEAFSRVLAQMVSAAASSEDLVLLGLKPTSPATGYGYIQAEKGNADNTPPLRITRFHEKPSTQLAQFYFEQPDYFWNLGIFAGKLTTFLREFKQHVPDLYEQLAQVVEGRLSYDRVQKISIDYCLMEKSRSLLMIPAQFEWYDIGNLASFLGVKSLFCSESQPVVSLQGEGNVALTNKKVVACIGVDDLCIVETADAIVVVRKDKAEAVKLLLPAIKEIEPSLL